LLTRLRLPPRPASGMTGIPLRRVGREELLRLVRTVERAAKEPSEQTLHGVRVALERARSAAELARVPRNARPLLAEARKLDDLLAAYEDAAAAERLLRAAAVGDERTAQAFVAGRIAERRRAQGAKIQKRLRRALKRARRHGAPFEVD